MNVIGMSIVITKRKHLGVRVQKKDGPVCPNIHPDLPKRFLLCFNNVMLLLPVCLTVMICRTLRGSCQENIYLCCIHISSVEFIQRAAVWGCPIWKGFVLLPFIYSHCCVRITYERSGYLCSMQTLLNDAH